MNDELEKLRQEVREAVACMDSCATIKPAHGEGFLDETWLAIRAELLRLADENARLLAANRDAVDHFEQMKGELAAIKARMQPCSQVVGGEVRVLMDPDDEGKYVAVVVVEE